MDVTVLVVFVLVYFGMALGRYPWLAIDRTGITLLGAIVLVTAAKLTPQQAWDAVDVPTLALTLGLMVISAQFRLGGFYARVARGLAAANVTPRTLLAMLIAVVAGLSAVLANDIVCLAITPVLVEGCARRNLKPAPFLLALACAANVGSAATLIGNPQNILIGQALRLDFARYLLIALPPVAVGLGVVWCVIVRHVGANWALDAETEIPEVDAPPFNVWQTSKGAVVIVAVTGLFLFSPFPREVVALAAAGILLTSRRMASRDILGLVDWHLLVLFGGLFVVNRALQDSGMLTGALAVLGDCGLDVRQPVLLFLGTVGLSNLVSNVPATMLLLPAATHPIAGPVLALSSTLAGNLFIVGSIANIIVVEQAARMGVRITWWDHVKVGMPVTVLTLLAAGAWLWAIS